MTTYSLCELETAFDRLRVNGAIQGIIGHLKAVRKCLIKSTARVTHGNVLFWHCWFGNDFNIRVIVDVSRRNNSLLIIVLAC